MNGSSGVKGQKCTVMGAEINVDEYGKRQGGAKTTQENMFMTSSAYNIYDEKC